MKAGLTVNHLLLDNSRTLRTKVNSTAPFTEEGMRIIVWISLAGCLSSIAGCSEIVRPAESLGRPTVEVVGDPTLPVTDSAVVPDILGSTATLEEDLGSMTGSEVPTSNPARVPDPVAAAPEEPTEPDVVGNSDLETAPDLRTGRREATKLK
jgi:hypothetical protein